MRKTVGERIFRSILYGQFEPIETIIALWTVVSGALILVPWNDAALGQTEKFLVYDSYWLFKGVGAAGVILGILHFIFMALSDNVKENACFGYRTKTLFAITFLQLFTAMEVLMAVGFSHPRWITYLALALVSAVSYLSLVIKR